MKVESRTREGEINLNIHHARAPRHVARAALQAPHGAAVASYSRSMALTMAGIVALLPGLSAADTEDTLTAATLLLSASTEAVRLAADAGLPRATVAAMEAHAQHGGVTRAGSAVLLHLANDEARALPLVVRAGGVATALRVLRAHAATPVVVRHAAFTLAHVLRARAPTPVPGGALVTRDALDTLLHACDAVRAEPAALAAALEVVADLLQQAPPPPFTREQEARAARAAAEGLQRHASSSSSADSERAAADLTYAACRVAYERLNTPAWHTVLRNMDLVSLLVRAMRAHEGVERVQCCTAHALLDLCTSAAAVDAAAAAGVVGACCAAARAHPGAARTQFKALALLVRCVSTKDAARNADVVRACLERGAVALADAALRAYSGFQAAPPAAGENANHTPGAAAALLLCSLLTCEPRAVLSAAPGLARTLLAASGAHLRASCQLAACTCALLSMLHGGGARLRGAELLSAVDCALLALRAHAREESVVGAAVPLLNLLCIGDGGGEHGDADADAAAARQRAVSEGAPALLRSAALAALRSRAPAVDEACKRRAVRDLAAACDACGGAPPGGRSGLKRCGACRTAAYCGAACQRAHWRTHHKAACAAMAAERAAAGGAGAAS
jgi:hypothetical protein